MIVFNIALNSIKRVLGNIFVVPFLIIMPIFQILFMTLLLGGNTGGYTIWHSDIFTITILEKVQNIGLSQTFSAVTLAQYIIMAGIIASSMLISDRESKTLMRMISTPVRKADIIVGNILGQSVIALVVAVFIIAISSIFIGINWGSSIIGIFMVTSFSIFVTIALGFVFSGLFKSFKLSMGVMTFFLVIMTFLSGGFTSDSQTTVISNFTLNKWIFDSYIIIMEGRNINSLFPNILVLGILGCLFSIIAICLYRRETFYE